MDSISANKIRLYYKANNSLRQCSKFFKISHEACRNCIPENEIRHKKLGTDRTDEILEAYGKTRSYTEAGKLVGVDRFTVYRVVKREGIQKQSITRKRSRA